MHRSRKPAPPRLKGGATKKAKHSEESFIMQYRCCHNKPHPIQLAPNITVYAGSLMSGVLESREVASFDYLVALTHIRDAGLLSAYEDYLWEGIAYHDSSKSLWDTFKGFILYTPIRDLDVLPFDVYYTQLNAIKRLLDKKKKVLIFCDGGHGRTGYILSGLAALYRVNNPVGYIRKKYCELAVETHAQEQHVQRLGEYLSEAHRIKGS